MKPLAVIPARRGSKRLRLKNILPLGGRPMLAYTVVAALESGVFESVFVSTEDEEIAQIAKDCGAFVHCRPGELAGDLVSATDVAIDCLRAFPSVDEEDVVVCLQPTSPLRDARDIAVAWEKMLVSDADFLVSTTGIDPHYFHWAVHQQAGNWQMFFEDRFMLERPLLPPVYRPNGAIKMARVRAALARRNFFGPKLTTYEMPEERSVHVAEQFDFDLAEFLISRRDPLSYMQSACMHSVSER